MSIGLGKFAAPPPTMAAFVCQKTVKVGFVGVFEEFKLRFIGMFVAFGVVVTLAPSGRELAPKATEGARVKKRFLRV